MGASTPSTVPSVAGRTSSRSTFRLRSALPSSEPPISGTSTTATFCFRWTVTSTGPLEAPFATASVRNRARASRTGAASMSSAFTTTLAGSDPPGNASSMWLYAVTTGSRSPNSWSMVRFAVFIPRAGTASAISAPLASASDSLGRRSTGPRTVRQTRLSPPPRRLARARNGNWPFSTRSPSSESSAGSTVTEPTIATATTIKVASPIALNSAIPVKSMPAIATITVTPETRTARPEVAAAIRSAVCASRPAARSSRSRRR
ncbi:hypothetical protein SANTM175S_04891 [Streptomyces antimycoticus]